MYKLEMHLHTIGRSPCAQVDEKTIAALYHEQGYDGIVCTNHYNRWLCENYYKKPTAKENTAFFIEGYETLKKECAPYGIDVFFGIELLLDCLTYYKQDPPKAELLVYGISPEWLLAHPTDLFLLSPAELFALCKKENWLLCHAHPFRDGIDTQDPQYLEGCEVFNGNPYLNNHNPDSLAFAEKNGLLYTAGSDFHTTEGIGCGVFLQNPVKTNEELVAELRKREHIVFKRPNATD